MSDDALLAVLRWRIKKRRLEQRLRQEDVADAAEMSLRSYQRFEAYESDKPFNPTLQKLLAISRVLDTTVPILTSAPSEEEIAALQEPMTERVWHDGKLV